MLWILWVTLLELSKQLWEMLIPFYGIKALTSFSIIASISTTLSPFQIFQNERSFSMNKISRFVIWICSKFTKSELEQIVKELTDVINNRNPEVKPKDDFKEKHPNYLNFYVDPTPPLTESKPILPQLNWKELLDNYQFEHKKSIKIVIPKNPKNRVPSDCICRTCGAPAEYLYFNDGKKRSQIKCKICNSLSPANPRHIYKSKYWCPHCTSPLQIWKRRSNFDIYRCINDDCSHYIKAKEKLNFAEKIIFSVKPMQFKLRYHFREFHFSNEQLSLSSPQSPSSSLTQIHNSLNTFALILTFHISFAISARKTALIMKKVFQIPVSYQTVLNYSQSAAYYCHKFNLTYKGKIDNSIAGDENYIKILGKNHFAFFFISSENRAVASYHIHDTRDTLPAVISLNEATRTAEPDQHITAITDGNPSYSAAILHINQSRPSDNPIIHKTVIGLQNLDSQSEEFRAFKQLIERFNRTYKYHIKPAYGFNIFNGAISTTVLFVTHYNFLRPHMALNYSVPVPLPELINIPTFQEQWTKILDMASKL
jgi:transposase-like protein